MATSILLKPNIILNPLVNQCSLMQLSPIKLPLARSPNFPRLITNPNITLKCSVSSENLTKPVLEPFKKETKTNPREIFANAVLKSLKTLQEATTALVLFMVVSFMSFSHNSALAAGGGRMGGSDFSSSSSSSSSSWSSPSSSSSSWSSPSSSSSILYDDDDDYSTPSYSSSSWSRGGGVTLLESVSVGTAKPPLTTRSDWSLTKFIVATVIVLWVLMANMDELKAPIVTTTSIVTATPIQKSILKLQIGVLGSAKSLQKELDRIAKTADTSTKAGLTYILTETTIAVLRHPDYCISAYSSVNVKSDTKDVETLYNRLTIEERAKLDEETLVNVNNKKKQSTSSKETTGIKNEYIVITIIVAAEGVLKLPKISNSEDLKEALKIIGSVTTNKTLGVEILWTPQDENEVLTERDVLEKYPLLRCLSDTL